MDIIKIAADALAPIVAEGVPVQQGWYDAALHKTHVTLWATGAAPEAHSDDDEEIEVGYVQVTIFSTADDKALAARVKRLMLAAGFTWQAEDQDETINDGTIYALPQRFEYMEEVTHE